MPPRTHHVHDLRRAVALLAAASGLMAALPSAAGRIALPPGERSSVAAESNNCNDALGSGCFLVRQEQAPAEFSNRLPASFVAGGSASPDTLQVHNQASEFPGGGFLWANTGGLFTLHGSGTAPVLVTASLAIDGRIGKSAPLASGGASWKIGSWRLGESNVGELNDRVSGVVADGLLCSFNQCGTGLSFQDLLTHSFLVVPGQVFNLGVQISSSTGSHVGTTAVVDLTGRFSLAAAGDAYFFTGDNGYDSRLPVPEPGSWALLLAGLGLLGVRRRWRLAARPLAPLALMGLLAAAAPASAAKFGMPDGGTSWIMASANACDLGTPALGADCFGAARLMPTAEYSLEPPASFVAGGQVFSDRIQLVNTAGQNGGGGFAWGATGGLFTLHGSGAAPVTVTATLKVDGQIDKSQIFSAGNIMARIGTWAFGAVPDELNFRVDPIVQSSDFCRPRDCVGLVADRLLTTTLSVLPGQSFNLGFQLTTVTSAAGPSLSQATVSALGVFALDAGPGYYITGDNGYDSRLPVPEPGSWALMLAGLALLGRLSRRRR